MAGMPKYSLNLKRYSPPEPLSQWPWNLECSIKWLSATKFVQIITLCWPWSILCQGKFGIFSFWMENAETVHFGVTIIICVMEMQRSSTPLNAER